MSRISFLRLRAKAEGAENHSHLLMMQWLNRSSKRRCTCLLAASASIGLTQIARAEAALSEAQKITHADAKYQPTPNGQQRCEICLQFEPPDHCKIVRSPISATGWCQYFAARDISIRRVESKYAGLLASRNLRSSGDL